MRQLPVQREPKILFLAEGKMPTFGGPHNLGMEASEDLDTLRMASEFFS
jgi:hypothetical protein